MDLSAKEKIVVVGFGWVGQANALALSRAGYSVFYYDLAEPKRHYADRYAELYETIKPLRSISEIDGPDTWYIVCVGDRVSPEGEQDISSIKKAVESLEGVKGGVILRSTILPERLSELKFDYYVPEFLHEKKAVEECMVPHYFIVGFRGKEKNPPSFFDVWERAAVKTFRGTPEEASHLKYLSNLWNSVRVAFVNEFGSAISLPTNREKLAKNEKLINFFFEEKSYLRYGRSYGGHCLPKDTNAYYSWYKNQGKNMALLEGVHKSNLTHKELEEKLDHMPEWFSDWVRPQISGRAAFSALKFAVYRKIKNIIKTVSGE